MTVCFVDVKESMHLAARVDPEEWHRIMDRFFAILADGIHRFEGTINQFTGDGVMALFGAPVAHEDHAQRACHAALQLREQLRLYAQELKRTRGLTFAVRTGLNSGEVIVGTIGDDLRMDYTAQGHTVGLAARMQQTAEAGAIYLTAHTAALVSSYFVLQPVGSIRLKGVSGSVRTFALVCRLVQTHSANAPTVLLIDDVHWIDAESDAFLAQLVEAVGWTRTLLLFNFRSDYSAEWMKASYYQQLQLAPLGADATDALLSGLVGADPSVAPVCAAVKERAQGNPFFIEEIVQSLVDQGVLVREHRRRHAGTLAAVITHVARPVTEIRIPATVQSLLAARIDSLPESAKQVLQAAAVIGKRFPEPVLRLALAMDATPADTRLDLAQALRTLQRADLIHPEPSEAPAGYAFKHPLTQEVAYHAQLQETRERKHEAVARALEVVHADRLGEHAALLAHHWEAANKRQTARLWRRRAALRVTTIQIRRESTRRPWASPAIAHVDKARRPQ